MPEQPKTECANHQTLSNTALRLAEQAIVMEDTPGLTGYGAEAAWRGAENAAQWRGRCSLAASGCRIATADACELPRRLRRKVEAVRAGNS